MADYAPWQEFAADLIEENGGPFVLVTETTGTVDRVLGTAAVTEGRYAVTAVLQPAGSVVTVVNGERVRTTSDRVVIYATSLPSGVRPDQKSRIENGAGTRTWKVQRVQTVEPDGVTPVVHICELEGP